MRILVLVAAALALTLAVHRSSPSKPFEPPPFFPGSTWVQLPPGTRLEYLAGVVDGMAVLARVVGGDVRPTPPAITYQRAAEIVYDRLLREPGLRSRSIASVIADTLLGAHLTILDPTGRPIEVEHTYRSIHSANG